MGNKNSQNNDRLYELSDKLNELTESTEIVSLDREQLNIFFGTYKQRASVHYKANRFIIFHQKEYVWSTKDIDKCTQYIMSLITRSRK